MLMGLKCLAGLLCVVSLSIGCWGDEARARELLAAGRAAEAYEAIVVELDVQSPTAATYEVAIDALLAAGRVVTALDVARRWIDEAQPEETPLAFWYGGEVAARNGDVALAVARFSTFLEHAGGGDGKGQRAIWYLLVHQQDGGVSAQALADLKASADARNACAAAVARLVQAKPGRGIKALKQLLAQYPRDVDAVEILQRLSASLGKLPENQHEVANALLLEVVKRDCSRRMLWVRLRKLLPGWVGQAVRDGWFAELVRSHDGAPLNVPGARLADAGNSKQAIGLLHASFSGYAAHPSDGLHFDCAKVLLDRGRGVLSKAQAVEIVRGFAARAKGAQYRGLGQQVRGLVGILAEYGLTGEALTALHAELGSIDADALLASFATEVPKAGMDAEDAQVRAKAWFVHRLGDNRANASRKVDYRCRKLAEDFLRSWKGEVPAGAGVWETADQALGWEVCRRHLHHVWHDGAARQDWGKIWGPRLGPGPLFVVAAKDAFGGGKNLRERYAALLERGAPTDPGLLWLLTGMRDLGIGYEPFVPLRLADLHDVSLYRELLQTGPVWRRDGGGERFTQAMWGYVLSGEAHAGEYDRVKSYAKCHWQHNVARQPKQAAAVVARFVAELDGLSSADRVNAINVFIDNSREATDTFTLDALLGLYEALPPGEVSRASAFAYVQHNIAFWLRDPETSATKKERARALRLILGRRLVEGMGRSATVQLPHDRREPARDWLLRRIKDGAWGEISEVIAAYQQHVLPGKEHKPADLLRLYNEFVQPVVDSLLAAGANELAYVIVRGARQRQYGGELEGRLESALAQVTLGLAFVPVDPNDPIYPLHQAGREMARGNMGRAWDLTAEHARLLLARWRDLSPQYVAWVIEQMRKYRQFELALALAFEFLATEGLDAELAAQVMLTRGDTYRDSQNMEAARLEYQSLHEAPALGKTKAGQQAQSRMIELMIAMRSYHNAEQLVAKLLDSPQVPVRAEALYLSALIAFEQEDYDGANEMVEQALRLDRSHAKALLLEGRLRLYVGRGLQETEIRLGEKRLRSKVVPGRTLRLTMHDDNLRVARHSESIPVRVWTRPGGDEELLQMYAAGGKQKSFVVTLPTTMAPVEVGNSRLEMYGDDVILYVLDKAFQQEHGLTYPEKVIEVHAEGRLVASAGRILREEEQEQLRMEARLGRGREQKQDGGKTIRPGNPVYLQVQDLDRNVSQEEDRVAVRLETSSGDRLLARLVEEDSHSGVFTGQVETGMPFPRAAVSDAVEGNDPNAVISTMRDGAWESVHGPGPKWILADTMTSEEIAEVGVRVAQAGKIKQVRLEGSLRGEPVLLAQLPPVQRPDGVLAQIVPGSGGRTLSDLRRFLGTAPTEVPKETEAGERQRVLRQDRPVLRETDVAMNGLHRVVSGRLIGQFFLAEDGVHELTVFGHSLDQTHYVLVDGVLVLSQYHWFEDAETIVARVELSAGVHELEWLLATPKDAWGEVGLQVDGEAMAGALFSRELPEIAAALEPNVTIERQPDGFVGRFRQPERMRKLRWVMDGFGERALKVSAFRVVGADGQRILPTEHDYTAGLQNETLEVAPGDKVTVRYHDEKRLNPNAPYLYAEMNAAYKDGSISASIEVVLGETLSYFPTYRCRRGDTLWIEVSDSDEDQSPGRDRLPIVVETSGGERLELEALESGGEEQEEAGEGVHTGRYRALLRIGDRTEGDTIRLDPGQFVTVGYLDRENLDPGVPFRRTVQISEAGESVPVLTVRPQLRYWQEAKGPEAREKLAVLQRKTYNAGRTDLQLWTSRVDSPAAEEGEQVATLVEGDVYRSSVAGPVLVEVTHPAAALHGGSVFRSVKVQTASDRAAAQREGREPVTRELSCFLEDLKAGVFGISLPLRVGSADTDTEVTGMGGTETKSLVSALLGPLEVGGTDTLYLQIDTVAGPVEKQVHLADDGMLELMDQSYTARSSMIHLGESFFVRLTDLDQDQTSERDTVMLVATTPQGRSEVTLTETFAHSGVFESRVTPVPPPAEGAELLPGTVQVNPGDEVVFVYEDLYRVRTKDAKELAVTGRIREGADAELATFTKTFQDPEMAVKTSFLMAESLFEMAKDRRKIGEQELAAAHIGEGKRALEEALRDYPDTNLKAQGEFLLANLAEEMGAYEEAIRRYASVLARWPDSSHAAQSLFKKALCLEKKGEPEQALEEYVRLTYTYKGSPLAADAVVRMASYYYKQKRYDASAEIFAKFQENHPHHRLASKSLTLAGLSHIKGEAFGAAMRCFDMVVVNYPEESDVRSEAMYWLGDSAVSAKEYAEAYRAFKQLTWDYPDSKWAKMARGRLTENVLLNAEDRQ